MSQTTDLVRQIWHEARDSMVEDRDAVYQKTHHKKTKYGERFHASDVALCLRKASLTRIGAAVTNGSGKGQISRMDLGSQVEEWLYQRMKKIATKHKLGTFKRWVEVGDVSFVAHPDALFYPENGEPPMVFEAKYRDARARSWRMKENDGLWVPYIHWCLQVCMAIDLMKRKNTPVQDTGLIFTFFNDGWEELSDVEYSKYKEILDERRGILEVSWDNGELPEVMNPKKFPCSYGVGRCEYFDQCHWQTEKPVGSIEYLEERGISVLRYGDSYKAMGTTMTGAELVAKAIELRGKESNEDATEEVTEGL